MSVTNRIGCFFLLVGVFAVVLYLASDAGGEQNCNFLLIGVLGTVLGFVLWRRNRTPPAPSSRFSGIRNLRQRASNGFKPPSKGPAGPPGKGGGGGGGPPGKGPGGPPGKGGGGPSGRGGPPRR